MWEAKSVKLQSKVSTGKAVVRKEKGSLKRKSSSKQPIRKSVCRLTRPSSGTIALKRLFVNVVNAFPEMANIDSNLSKGGD